MDTPLVDAHCHMGTDPLDPLPVEPGRSATSSTTERVLMSTNPWDWARVQSTATSTDSAQPLHCAFGIHPWYAHLFSFGPVSQEEHYRSVLQYPESQEDTATALIAHTLPAPRDIEEYIGAVDFSTVSAIGEVGLDRSFTLPASGFYQGRDSEGRVPARTRVRVSLAHQQRVFERMCRLAAERALPLSLHAVNAHMPVFEICQRTILHSPSVRLCLHSYTGSTEFLAGQWLRTFSAERVFVSVSRWINFREGSPGRLDIARVPPQCILTETDYVVDGEPRDLDSDIEYLVRQLTPLLRMNSPSETRRLVHANLQRFLSRAE